MTEGSNKDGPNRTTGSSLDLAKTNSSGSLIAGTVDSSFWYHDPEINSSNWNKSLPYQLIVVKATHGEGEVSYTGDNNFVARFTLPIPPESLSYSMPFAIGGSVTQGGFLEEHNGVPIRTISLRGTTGVLPLRGAAPGIENINPGEAIFAGVVQNAKNFQNIVDRTRTLLSGEIKPKNLVPKSVLNGLGAVPATSGYYQFRLLKRWLENYALYKKTEEGRGARLAFCMWKDEAVYLVKPERFDVNRSAGSPLEYNYSLSFVAYRRVKLEQSPPAASVYKPAIRQPSVLARALAIIEAARAVIQNTTKLIGAIGGDLEASLFGPIRQVAVFLKDIVGAPLSVADLGRNVVASARDAILEYARTAEGAKNLSEAWKLRTNSIEADISQLDKLFPKNDPLQKERGKELPYGFKAKISISSLNLNPTTQQLIAQERAKARRLAAKDMRDHSLKVQRSAAEFANYIGAGNETYNKLMGITPPKKTKRKPSQEDLDVLFALNRIAMEMNRLAASYSIDRKLSPVEYVAGLSQQAGIAFRIPRSKYLVPFPYNYSLEELARQYLGTPDRWNEIATLNGLRAPYIDEVGFSKKLVVNGSGNQIVVESPENLLVGQMVWLSDLNSPRTQRRITKIEPISANQTILTLDGDADLGNYTVGGLAEMHAFLPHTVNSQQLIYIPSDRPPAQQDAQTMEIPGVDKFDRYLQAGGVDLLLTSDGDLALTPDGDCRLAVGLTNIIQQARIRISIPRGSLLRHPEIGLSIEPGMSTADLSSQDLYGAVSALFADDPNFAKVTSAAVSKNGPTATIGVVLQVAGTNELVPITATLR